MSTYLSLKRLKSADKRFKYSVFGYIREYEEDKPVNVPIMINYICLSYYLLTEKFTKHGDEMVLNESNETVTKTDYSYNNTVYGGIIIDGEDDSIIEYEWKFKVILKGWIGIGIDSSNKKCINTDFTDSDDNGSQFYGVVMNHRKKAFLYDPNTDPTNDKPNCDIKLEPSSGQHVKMTLNTNDKSLRFECAGEYLPIYHKDIDFDHRQYNMAIVLSSCGDHVQLTKFSIKQRKI